MNPVGDPENIMRETMARPSTAILTKDVGEVRPTQRKENTSGDILCTAQALAAIERARNEEKASTF